MTVVRVAWHQLRRQPFFAAMAIAFVISTLLSAGAGWLATNAQHATARQNDRLEQLVEDLQNQSDIDRARQCIGSWETTRGARSVIEGLIFAAQNADPARVEAFREDMARRLPDPDCDLAAALEVVAEADADPDRPIKETS